MCTVRQTIYTTNNNNSQFYNTNNSPPGAIFYSFTQTPVLLPIFLLYSIKEGRNRGMRQGSTGRDDFNSTTSDGWTMCVGCACLSDCTTSPTRADNDKQWCLCTTSCTHTNQQMAPLISPTSIVGTYPPCTADSFSTALIRCPFSDTIPQSQYHFALINPSLRNYSIELH